MHIPGYQYCGPGTKPRKRLERGDTGINPLDEACKVHDRTYSKFEDTATRNIADEELAASASPKMGGFLPFLLPLLGSLGAVAGGAATIAKAVNDAKTNRKELEEQKSHNGWHESAVPTQTKRTGLNIIEEDDNTSRPKYYHHQHLPKPQPNCLLIPKERKYRENIRTLQSENKGLTENVEKLENKLEIFQKDVLENITLKQYLKLTLNFVVL
ncbi:hypothetical protein NQ317_017923 [Molorchus minor]|uniref:Phospholipase A2-like domain-containing protein n=1 Tax=Molorchus minor TaxID=1323400 RepID=A0ABQ9J4Y3_9CUCU|nr:hypothetical protein NQ317_017923 [Molorchus minor]